jgi:hypothetical protein
MAGLVDANLYACWVTHLFACVISPDLLLLFPKLLGQLALAGFSREEALAGGRALPGATLQHTHPHTPISILQALLAGQHLCLLQGPSSFWQQFCLWSYLSWAILILLLVPTSLFWFWFLKMHPSSTSSLCFCFINRDNKSIYMRL